MRWLEMPIAMVHAHLAMLPRLYAQESLRAVHVHGVGAGTLEEKTRTSLIRSWERTLNGGTLPRARPMTADAAARMGIPIVFEPAPTGAPSP